jgi:hypothetical protein
MALLCDGKYRRVGGGRPAAEESICESAESKQVFLRGQQLMFVSRVHRRGIEVGPVSWNQGAASIRQNEHEIEPIVSMCMAEDSQRLPVKGVIEAGDGHLRGEVPEVGSVWRFPSTESITTN